MPDADEWQRGRIQKTMDDVMQGIGNGNLVRERIVDSHLRVKYLLRVQENGGISGPAACFTFRTTLYDDGGKAVVARSFFETVALGYVVGHGSGESVQ